MNARNQKPCNVSFGQKYKPLTINDFHICDKTKFAVRTLMDINELNILLVGNVCKTTLVYAIIREYYGTSTTSNNVLIINNLTEQCSNFYRTEVKNFCQLKSTVQSKKKMVVIDDFDTLPTTFQKIICSLMDKYANNVCFVYSCTNAQKAIENIRSRVHSIQIEPLSKQFITDTMERIVATENIPLSQESKDFVAFISDGNIRNMINFLEKLYVYYLSTKQTISVAECRQVCSYIPTDFFSNFVLQLKDGNITDAITDIFAITDYGYSIIDILDMFYRFLKITDSLTDDEKYRIVPIICKYTNIFNNLHDNVVELALFTNEINACIHKTQC